MQTDFLGNLGIDAGYLIVLLFMIQILLFILLISVNMKYNRLKRSYSTFMKGKDGTAIAFATRSLSLTLPERYSSAVSQPISGLFSL